MDGDGFQISWYSYKAKRKICILAKTNHPIVLWTPAVVQEKIVYTHDNPVRAGYVLEPHEWYLSSACPRSPIKVLSL